MSFALAVTAAVGSAGVLLAAGVLALRLRDGGRPKLPASEALIDVALDAEDYVDAEAQADRAIAPNQADGGSQPITPSAQPRHLANANGGAAD